MDLGATIGLFAVLGTVATFLCYYISRVLNFDDAHRVDKIPSNDFEA